MKITFPDKKIKEFPEGVSGLDIAKSISNSLAKEVIAVGVNGETYDATRSITQDAEIKLYKWDDEEGKHAFWHSSAHLMAEVLELFYPGVKLGIGPTIENGFYYDIDLPEGKSISDNDFKKIEGKMLEVARGKHQFIRTEQSKDEALKYFTEKDDEYKIELISELEDGTITFYKQNNFTDLCKGPHLPNTGHIKAVKLMKIAGAYWRGDEKRKQLTRVYGISFPKQKMLDEYLVMLEEAMKRDHRKIGKELELFAFSQRVGQGLTLVTKRSAIA